MLPNGRGGLYRGRIIIAGDRISEVAVHAAGEDTAGPDLDFGTHVALPGFIDLQINGAFGHDVTVDPPAMWRIGAELPRHGVTAFAPTIITSPPPRRRAAYEAARTRPAGYSGAEPLGLHLEGPALAAARAGAHPPAGLLDDAGGLADELTAAADVVALVTVAPELEGSTGLIRRLARAGIAVSLGSQRRDRSRGIGGAGGRGHRSHAPLQRHGPAASSRGRHRRRRTAPPVRVALADRGRPPPQRRGPGAGVETGRSPAHLPRDRCHGGYGGAAGRASPRCGSGALRADRQGRRRGPRRLAAPDAGRGAAGAPGNGGHLGRTGAGDLHESGRPAG